MKAGILAGKTELLSSNPVKVYQSNFLPPDFSELYFSESSALHMRSVEEALRLKAPDLG